MQNSRNEIKRDNLQAQILKLQSQAAAAVKDTKAKFDAKNKIIAEIEKLDETLRDKNLELSQVLSAIESSEKKLNQTTTDLEQAEIDLQDSIGFRMAEEKKLRITQEDLGAKEQALRAKILVIEEQVSDAQRKHDTTVEGLQIETAGLDRQIQKQRLEVEELVENANSALALYEEVTNKNISRDEELQNKQEELDKKEEELQAAATDYKQRVDILKRKESDIEIVTKRIKKKYEKEYPGRKLII